MTYSHVQILLYRPFLHYFVDSTEGNGHAEHGFHKYASACVDASRNLIHLTEDMHRDGLLYGAHWRIAYMVCTAGLSLVYVVVGSKSPDTVKALKIDLNTAKRMLMCLTPYSSHSRRLHVALTVWPFLVRGWALANRPLLGTDSYIYQIGSRLTVAKSE